MARVELRNNGELARARRMLRRGGCYTLTVRHGNVYTYKVSEQRQPNSVSQKEQRSIFEKANAIVAKELKCKGRLEYWRKVANESGKKTARGAAIAYWCRRLKLESEKKTLFNSSIKAYNTGCCRESHDSGYKNSLRNIWIGRKKRLILQTFSEGEAAGKVLSLPAERIEMIDSQTGWRSCKRFFNFSQ